MKVNSNVDLFQMIKSMSIDSLMRKMKKMMAKISIQSRKPMLNRSILKKKEMKILRKNIKQEKKNYQKKRL